MQVVGTFTNDSGRTSSLQHGSVLNGGDQLLVRRVALLLWRQLSVQGAGSAPGPPRGPGGVVLCPGSRLGQAPSCCAAAAVWEGERPDAAVQGVGGSSRTCTQTKEMWNEMLVPFIFIALYIYKVNQSAEHQNKIKYRKQYRLKQDFQNQYETKYQVPHTLSAPAAPERFSLGGWPSLFTFDMLIKVGDNLFTCICKLSKPQWSSSTGRSTTACTTESVLLSF